MRDWERAKEAMSRVQAGLVSPIKMLLLDHSCEDGMVPPVESMPNSLLKDLGGPLRLAIWTGKVCAIAMAATTASQSARPPPERPLLASGTTQSAAAAAATAPRRSQAWHYTRRRRQSTIAAIPHPRARPEPRHVFRVCLARQKGSPSGGVHRGACLAIRARSVQAAGEGARPRGGQRGGGGGRARPPAGPSGGGGGGGGGVPEAEGTGGNPACGTQAAG